MLSPGRWLAGLNSPINGQFRWWLLGTVVLLNLANYAHWIAFPAVAKKVTKVFREFFSKLKIFRPPLITR